MRSRQAWPRSPKQAVAIGLSKALRAGVKLSPPRKGSASAATRKQATRDLAKGRTPARRVSGKRSRATSGSLKKKEGHNSGYRKSPLCAKACRRLNASSGGAVAQPSKLPAPENDRGRTHTVRAWHFRGLTLLP